MRRAARRALLAALAATLLAGCASDGPRSRGNRLDLGGPYTAREREELRRADPSKVIAAELAFARLAQEKGQWTAFIETSTGEAVMFVPQPVNAHDWLRQQTNPAQAVRWQPHQVWSSCDGTLAVTKSAWQRPDGSVGYFTTVWQRQDNGEYKWVMDQGDVLREPLAAPEMIDAKVAQCHLPRPMPAPGVPIVEADEQHSGGKSDDFTLHWDVITRSDGSRTVDAIYWNGSDWERALREQVAGG